MINLPKIKGIKIQDKLLLVEIILYTVLSLIYPFIVEKFAYKGYVYEFNFVKFLIALGIILFLLFIGKTIRKGLIGAVWHIYLVYLMFPATIFYYTTNSSIHLLFINLIFLGTLFFGKFISIKIKFSRLSINNKRNYYLLGAITLIMFIPFLIFYSKYININNLFLKEIYETRYIFREIRIPVLNYMINPMVRVFLPVLIIASIVKKKYKLVLIFSLMVLYLFMCGAFRSYLFGFFAILLFYKGNYEFKPIIFGGILIFLIVFGYIFNNHLFYLLDAGIRRFLFVPVNLNNIYYEYFKDSYLYWSHNPIGNLFFEYPFDKGLTAYVGQELIGKSGLNANVGVIIEGFVSAGYFGVILHSIFFTFIFVFLNHLKISPRYFGILFIFLFTTNNSLIALLFITHGFLVYLIITALFLKETDNK
ncbi:MAG: O-antigen polymerase [Thiohalospira sp.]